MRRRRALLFAMAAVSTLLATGALLSVGSHEAPAEAARAAGASATAPRPSARIPAQALRKERLAGPLRDVATRLATIGEVRERWTHPAGPDAARRARRDRSSAAALGLLREGGLLRARGPVRTVGEQDFQRVRLFKQGRPVFNRSAVLELDGAMLVGRRGRVTLPPVAAQEPVLTRDQAIRVALDAAGITTLRGDARATLGWYAQDRATLSCWRVTIPAARPLGSWQVIVDAHSGRVLSAIDLLRTATGSGSVYDPNVALSPTPSTLPLLELDGSGTLSGSLVRVFDRRGPGAFVPSLQFLFPPTDARFVQTSVYRGLTDTALFAIARGFPAFPSSLYAFTNLPDPVTGTGEFNNAFYDPLFGLFGFGNGDGIVTANLGTDLDVAAHEMGHHLFEVLVAPDVFSPEDPSLAMSEGVADTFAALVGGDPNVGESTIPGQPYLRTLLNNAVFPDAISADPHLTGLVYGGTNWELIQLLGEAPFTQLLFAALAQLPADALETDYRDALLQANLTTRGGANQAQIQAILTSRGFDTLDPPPEYRGELEEGLPQSRFLPDSPFVPDPANWNFDIFVFSEFPGSTGITFQTTGSGDVDLVVAPLSDPNAPAATSTNVGSSETIALGPGSVPSVDDDDLWIVVVVDYPDGLSSSYTLSVTTSPPLSQISIGGAPVSGSIAVQGELDFLPFQASSATPVVRVEVQGLAPSLDPIAAVVRVNPFEVVAFDDDGGPGTDALIQGALLPGPGLYAVAVLSDVQDIDPTSGTGPYEVRLSACNNVGPNTDGDALVDACDDDDDNDGFVDGLDTNPLDANLCADVDADGCDDCSSGVFDPLMDGPDNDSDATCDVADPDDDNDGCVDGVDPLPFAPSPDADLDFLGADCDNCPLVANPTQADGDGDQVGDACDNCQDVVNPSQGNADGDPYGNACDCDFDQDGTCTISDFNVFLQDFAVGMDGGTGTDMDEGGTVGIGDFNLFLPGFQAGAPGP